MNGQDVRDRLVSDALVAQRIILDDGLPDALLGPMFLAVRDLRNVGEQYHALRKNVLNDPA